MRVVVSAGGTGGHIYPALSILTKITEKEPESEVLYIGTLDRMEAEIVPKKGINYFGVEMKGLNRRNPLKNIAVFNNYRQAKKKIKEKLLEFKPDVVLGVGGYITLPVVEVAHSLGIKTFVHEQNSIPGLSNKILNRKADKIGVSLKDSLKHFDKNKVVFTGNPRAEEIIKAEPIIKSKYNLSNNKKLVLIVMGSLGSFTINKKMKEILPRFRNKSYEVLFVTGKEYYHEYNKLADLSENVQIYPFLDDMLGVLKKTDLIISRAGASTIAEITAIGIPSILIPSPYVTHNHQQKNAEVLANKGASVIIREDELFSDVLIEKVDEIMNSNYKYNLMKRNSESLGVKDSATRIYQIIKELVDGV